MRAAWRAPPRAWCSASAASRAPTEECLKCCRLSVTNYQFEHRLCPKHCKCPAVMAKGDAGETLSTLACDACPSRACNTGAHLCSKRCCSCLSYMLVYMSVTLQCVSWLVAGPVQLEQPRAILCYCRQALRWSASHIDKAENTVHVVRSCGSCASSSRCTSSLTSSAHVLLDMKYEVTSALGQVLCSPAQGAQRAPRAAQA